MKRTLQVAFARPLAAVAVVGFLAGCEHTGDETFSESSSAEVRSADWLGDASPVLVAPRHNADRLSSVGMRVFRAPKAAAEPARGFVVWASSLHPCTIVAARFSVEGERVVLLDSVPGWASDEPVQTPETRGGAFAHEFACRGGRGVAFTGAVGPDGALDLAWVSEGEVGVYWDRNEIFRERVIAAHIPFDGANEAVAVHDVTYTTIPGSGKPQSPVVDHLSQVPSSHPRLVVTRSGAAVLIWRQGYRWPSTSPATNYELGLLFASYRVPGATEWSTAQLVTEFDETIGAISPRNIASFDDLDLVAGGGDTFALIGTRNAQNSGRLWARRAVFAAGASQPAWEPSQWIDETKPPSDAYMDERGNRRTGRFVSPFFGAGWNGHALSVDMNAAGDLVFAWPQLFVDQTGVDDCATTNRPWSAYRSDLLARVWRGKEKSPRTLTSLKTLFGAEPMRFLPTADIDTDGRGHIVIAHDPASQFSGRFASHFAATGPNATSWKERGTVEFKSDGGLLQLGRAIRSPSGAIGNMLVRASNDDRLFLLTRGKGLEAIRAPSDLLGQTILLDVDAVADDERIAVFALSQERHRATIRTRVGTLH